DHRDNPLDRPHNFTRITAMEQPFISLQSDNGPQRVPIADKPLTIGRHPDNLLVITDTQASRFHAVIGKSKEGYVVKDLDSRNGTRLNGQPVKAAKLNPGDVVALGTTEIQFITGNSAKASGGKPPQPPQRKQPAVVEEQAAHGDDPPDLSALEQVGAASPEDQLVEDIFGTPSNAADLMADFGAASGQQDDEKFLPVVAESL